MTTLMPPLSLTCSHPCSWPHPCPTHQIIFILGPLVLKAIQALQDGLFACAHTTFSTPLSCLLSPWIPHYRTGRALPHQSHCQTRLLVLRLSSFVNAFVTGPATCQQNKVNHHPTCPPLSPTPSSTLLPFKRQHIHWTQCSINVLRQLQCSGVKPGGTWTVTLKIDNDGWEKLWQPEVSRSIQKWMPLTPPCMDKNMDINVEILNMFKWV